jgi:uncharacterized protein YhaN
LIDLQNGEEFKIPESGDLTKIADLTPSECSNLFIIRNSDLSIPDEGEFYTQITDRLTGLRMEEICRIEEILKETAKVTPGGVFRDIRGEKLKTRLDGAQALISVISQFMIEIEKEGYDHILEELVKNREHLESIERNIKKYDDARKRERYERGLESLSVLEESKIRISDFALLNETDEDTWRVKKRDIERYTDEREVERENLAEKEKDLKTIKADLRDRESAFVNLQERKRQIDGEVKPLLINYDRTIEERAGQQHTNSFLSIILISFLFFVSLSIAGFILRPSTFFLALLAFCFIVAGVSSIFKYRIVRRRVVSIRAFQRINEILAKFHLQAADSDKVRFNIQQFEEDYATHQAEIDQIRMDLKIAEAEIQKVNTMRIPDIVKKMEKAQDEIESIKKRSGKNTVQEYTKGLSLKRKFKALIEENKNFLSRVLGDGGMPGGQPEGLPGEEDMIAHWNKEIKSLESFKEEATDLVYNETDLTQLKEEENKCRSRIGEIEDKLVRFEGRLLEIEKEANSVLQLEDDYAHCKTSLDLRVVRDSVQSFIDENERRREDAFKALNLIEEIKSEEKEKITQNFGKDSEVSRYFSEITESRYSEAVFNQESMQIEIIRRDGRVLRPEDLSAGTFDQLYLSIRLALGSSLLRDKRGFFIMDDPFIKSDAVRLERQLAMLRAITEWGWQILYFSAKNEVRECLQSGIEKNEISCIELPGIEF